MAQRQHKIISDVKKLLGLFMDGATFCAFDTETTGLLAANGHIVEIGAIRFDRNGTLDCYSTLINPGCPMPPDATRINNITNEMLRDCPSAEQIIPSFLEFSQDTILVAHNAGFDVRYMNIELERAGFSMLRNKVVDTLNLSKRIFPDLPNHRLQTLAYHLGIKSLHAHRAADDARVCMEVFIKCLSDIR